MDTESNQSNEDRYHDPSQEDERQRTGLFRWEEPHNLMPPWSVPPGLLVPKPHQPAAEPAQPGRPRWGVLSPRSTFPPAAHSPPQTAAGGPALVINRSLLL